MPVKPRDLFESAKLVHAQQSNEAGYRAAISRAYYAAFHAAREFHKSLPLPGRVGNASGTHEQLIAQLISPGIPNDHPKYYDSQSVGYILRDVHKLRVTSDYNLADGVEAGDAEEAILTSEKILKSCKSY